MDLLVPGDHVAQTHSLLDRRLAMPEGPLHDRYHDVLARVTDHVQSGDIASDPVSTGKLAQVTDDPDGFVAALVHDKQLHESIVGAVAGGGTAMIASLAVGIAVDRIRDGDFHGIAWTNAALRASKVGGVAAAVGAVGMFASTQAQEAVAAGSENLLAGALSGGNLAFAMARGSMSVAVAAHGFATGRLTPAEAAASASEGITRTASVWACAAVGQAVIPIPVIGAMIGGMVGQYGAAMMVQGLNFALVARDTSAEWDRAYRFLVNETVEVMRSCEEERHQLALLAEGYNVGFTRHVLPALEGMAERFWTGDPDTVLAELADLALLYEGTPQFSSLAEFDTFMGDPTTTLMLDLGSKRRA